jgi:hypothetical protein
MAQAIEPRSGRFISANEPPLLHETRSFIAPPDPDQAPSLIANVATAAASMRSAPPRHRPILPKPGESTKIHDKLGIIWEIPKINMHVLGLRR